MKRTVNGVQLVGEPGYWRTVDGEYEIARQEYETECDTPHPVRKPLPVRDWKGDWVPGPKWHEGGELHFYWQWHVWDLVSGDYVGCTDKRDTLAEAINDLRRHLEGRCNCNM